MKRGVGTRGGLCGRRRLGSRRKRPLDRMLGRVQREATCGREGNASATVTLGRTDAREVLHHAQPVGGSRAWVHVHIRSRAGDTKTEVAYTHDSEFDSGGYRNLGTSTIHIYLINIEYLKCTCDRNVSIDRYF